MVVNKLKTLIEKYKLSNIIKVVIILIVLYLLAKIFMPTINTNFPEKMIEGFQQKLGYENYGNQLSLQDPMNTPIYNGNTCTFKFDSVYRIEAFTLVFNNNLNVSPLTNPAVPFNPDNFNTIYVQYEDGNGSLRYIKSSIAISPPNFYNSTNLGTFTNASNNQQYKISMSDITDENNLAVYTSKIIVTIGDSSNKIDTYIDNCNIGYISNFDFKGSTRDMLSRKDFEDLSPTSDLRTFAYGGTNYDSNTNSDTYIYTTVSDLLMYGISLNYVINPVQTSETTIAQVSLPTNVLQCKNTTNSPFKLSIVYNNGLYTGNNFTINTKYTIRNDPLKIDSMSSNQKTEYIILAQPIITNKIVINIPRVNITNTSNTSNSNMLKLILTGFQGYGTVPTQNNISDYQRTINALLSAASQGQNLDICPSVDNLVSKQNQAQQICDNLEYQDKVKSEKLRLERNKQYLLKLKQQQQQIDQLNQVIQTLDGKRQNRSQTADVARVLQFQHQKEIASTIRDLANQRLESQDNNKLYLDVNINGQ